VPGYKPIALANERYHVAAAALFTSDDLLGVRMHRSGSALELTLSPELAGQVAGLVRNHGGDRLAVMMNGALVGTGKIRTARADGRVFLAGMAQPTTMHLINVLNAAGRNTGGATVSLVPRQSVVRPGDALTVDVYVEAANLRAYQLQVAVTGASTGPLQVVSLSIDTARPDYAFASGESIEASNPAFSRIGAVLFRGSVTSEAGPMYVGSYTFATPQDVSGTLFGSLVPGPDSFLRDVNSAPIPFRIVAASVASSAPPADLRGATPARKDK
jgi:hypothetical protein